MARHPILTRRRAAVVVESAIVLPFTLLFMLAIFEYGRFFMFRHLATHATREGARFAVVNTYNKTTLDVQNLVESKLYGQTQHVRVSDAVPYTKTTNIQVFHANAAGNPIKPDGSASTQSDLSDAPFTNAKFAEPIVVRIVGVYKPIVPHIFTINDNRVQIMANSVNIRVVCQMNSEAN